MAVRMLVFASLVLLIASGYRTFPQARQPAAPQRPAHWIWSPSAVSPGAPVYFRQNINLSEAPAAATLRAGARGRLVVYVNGKVAAAGAGEQAITGLDVRPHLVVGRNVLAFEVASSTGGGLAFELKVRFRGDREAVAVSNGDERVSTRFENGWELVSHDDRSWQAVRLMEIATAAPQRPAAAPTSRANQPAPAAPATQPAAPSEPQTASDGMDYSRLIRVWDISREGKPDADPYAGPRAVGERMLLTTSVPAANEIPLVASAGFTLLQTDSDHLSTNEVQPGRWDFGVLDSALRQTRNAGLDWCLFPHFAFPPKWYSNSVTYTRIRCLEHDQPVEAFSPWDPKWPPFVARGYEVLAEHYGHSATQAGRISGLYLGVHGDYGEAGLLMGARTSVPGQREEWQTRFGNLHNHLGWWCGDPLARAAFRQAMMRKYGDVEALNAAWKTRFRSENDIVYPVSPAENGRRWWLDFVHWYLGSVGNAAEMVARTARQAFPNTLLMLPAGFADENPRGGNDNSLIPKIAGRIGVDVRSTHGGFKPFAENQASMLGRLASASRFYGAPFWTEPPGKIDADTQVARIFAAVSLGSKGYFDWSANVLETRDVYYRFGKFLRVEQPVVDVAMFFPTTSHLLRPDAGYPQTLLKGCAEIRDILNYDILDERMIQDGALERYRVLVMWEGVVAEAATLDTIREWVRGGGVIVAYDFGKIETVEGDQSWFRDLFGYAGGLAAASANRRFVPERREALPSRYRVSVGNSEGAPFLMGDWHMPEPLGQVTGRWTGANAEVIVPVDPKRSYVLILRASARAEAGRKVREVLVNGRKVGDMDGTEDVTYRFAVPSSLLGGRETATVTIRCETWVPADVLPGSMDRRSLGVWVRYLQMEEADAAQGLADPPALRGRLETLVDTRRLQSDWARPYGRGWTVYYPARRAQLQGYYEVVRYVTYQLSAIDPLKRDAIPIDNQWDGVYATLFTDKALFYNPLETAVARKVDLPSALFEGRRDVLTPKAASYSLTLEPNSIGAIYFGDAPVEMLLQAEKFLDLGGLRPQTDSAFSPGQGTTHVLVPVGRQISTRFEVETPGTYRVFYRATRRGAPAVVEVAVDGTALRPAQEPQHRGAVPATRYAGVVSLASGVHTLTLKPLTGQDARMDFVVLTNDNAIAGYTFAPRVRSSR